MDTNIKTFSVSIYRTDPQDSSRFWYDSFKVPFEGGQSVLGVLRYIYETYDPSLAFYGSCRIGKCTGCHVRVNGKTRLACTTMADGSDLRVEPLPGYPIVRDLVVDKTKETSNRRVEERSK